MLLFVVARSRLDRYEELRPALWRQAQCQDHPRSSWRRASVASSHVLGSRPTPSGATPWSQCRELLQARLGRDRYRRTRVV